MQIRAESAKTLKRLDKALESEDNTEFLAAFKECANRGYGMPKQAVDLTTKGEALMGDKERAAAIAAILTGALAR